MKIHFDQETDTLTIRFSESLVAESDEEKPMSEKEYDFENARQGPVAKPRPNKTRITIRIDTDVLNWFRQQVHAAGGGNYQTLINEALRAHVQGQDGTLEKTLRRVIREELGK